MIDKEHILSEIKRTADENGGRPLGLERFAKVTGINPHDWYGVHWTKWGDALIQAGFEPNEWQGAYNPDMLLACMTELIEELGHFPTQADIRMKSRQDPNFPSREPFKKLGFKEERIQKVLEYAKAHKASESVVAICQTALDAMPGSAVPSETSSATTFGFVYLMKSGKHFKIGRSNCAERREYELRILLPENLELVHKIKTDDPAGIEKYWHGRFKDKRKGGEWFELTASDLKAFKLRKFM